ncbi:MAG: hypothetical protein OXH69_02530, partial [Acidobacteria bacterium]|nr:hypothetical protein [Acidobacteriota bacterium]
GLGHRSIDNMMINIGQAVYMNDAEFAAEVAKRKELLGVKAGEDVLGCPLCSYEEFPRSMSRQLTDNDND